MASTAPTKQVEKVEKVSSVKVKPNDGDEIEVAQPVARISGLLSKFQSDFKSNSNYESYSSHSQSTGAIERCRSDYTVT